MNAENYWSLGNQIVGAAFAQTVAYALALGTQEFLSKKMREKAACIAASIFSILATVCYCIAVYWIWRQEHRLIDRHDVNLKAVLQTSKSAFWFRELAVIALGLFSLVITVFQYVGAKYGY